MEIDQSRLLKKSDGVANGDKDHWTDTADIQIVQIKLHDGQEKGHDERDGGNHKDDLQDPDCKIKNKNKKQKQNIDNLQIMEEHQDNETR